jgi:hypothetical protein
MAVVRAISLSAADDPRSASADDRQQDAQLIP